MACLRKMILCVLTQKKPTRLIGVDKSIQPQFVKFNIKGFARETYVVVSYTTKQIK
jgi:hypothetical protein